MHLRAEYDMTVKDERDSLHCLRHVSRLGLSGAGIEGGKLR